MSRTYKPIELTEYEQWIVDETRKTGNLNLFTNYFMRLANSGSLWLPGDAIGHYRHLFTYEMLYDAWRLMGKPEDAFTVAGETMQYQLRVLWEGETPRFLLPHGYLMLDWALPMVHRQTNLGLAITGTGTSKTSSVAVAALAYCALYPGFHFLNVAPTEDQAALITIELEKWISDTPYATKFIQLTRSGELYKTKPRPTALIRSPFNPRYLSRFVCQTVGRDANSILGSNQDWINIDEVQLMTGIDAALPKLMTRSRAQRSDGLPRWSKLTMLTNPGPGVELTEIRKKIVAIQDDKESIIKAVYIDGIDSSSNPYNTKLQAAFHRSLMDASDISRWLDGDMTSMDFTRSLPETLFERCRDQALEDAITKDGKYQPVKREGIGLLHYAVPPETDKFYMVVGDPGQGNLTKMNQNNIPVVMVLDITDFLVKPSQLVMLTIPDGMGHYDAWLECFKDAMSTYHAKGYYDDTNTQGAFESSGAFRSGYWNEKTGQVDKNDYETLPISFANLNKRWARTIFVTLAGDGMFRWPYLHRLWHEAGKYKEYGEGSKDQADDMLASLFIYCLALRAEGGLWEKYAKRYYVDYDEKRKKLIERQMLAQNSVQAVANRAVARANGSRFRGVRQR